MVVRAVLVFLTAAALCGCLERKPEEKPAERRVVTVGYAQVGHESDWRTANTESFKSTFTEENGFRLLFVDADGDQSRQVAAIRDFIAKKVDYIVLAPVVETGWDDVLRQAKEAGIPVILSDRQLKVADETLYLCWVGGNFLREGRESVKWLAKYLERHGRADERMNIVDIQGALGASAQKGRTKGIEEGIRAHENWHLVARESGEWSEETGRRVMADIIARLGVDQIDAVFAENDNMAWGAIDALRAAGAEPGKRPLVVSFDAVRESFNRMVKGEINCDCECNPLHGPRVAEIIRTLERGETVDRIQYVPEGVFDETNAAQALPTRAY